MLNGTELLPLSGNHAEWAKLHDGLITGRNVAALPGIECHPKLTALALHHKHRGDIDVHEQPDSGLFRRGRWYEHAAPAALAEVRPDLTFEKCSVFIRNQRLRAGATPDGFITDRRGRKGPAEIKTCSRTVFDQFYREPGSAAPAALIQLLLAMWLLEAPIGWIIALLIDEFNPEIRIVEVEPHEPSYSRLAASLEYHWQCVDRKQEPEVELTAADRELMTRMFGREAAAKSIDLSTDNELVSMLHERAELRDQMKIGEERCKAIEALVMQRMGDAERAVVPDFRITWKTTHYNETKPIPARDIRVLRITDQRPE